MSMKIYFNINGDLRKAKNSSMFIVDLQAPEHTALYYSAANYGHRGKPLPLIQKLKKKQNIYFDGFELFILLLPANIVFASLSF